MTAHFDPGFVARQFRLDGKAALITGGRGALAEAIAAALADLGCDVALASRHEKDCEETAAGIAARFGRKAIGLRCDISNEEEVEAAVGATSTMPAPRGGGCRRRFRCRAGARWSTPISPARSWPAAMPRGT